MDLSSEQYGFAGELSQELYEDLTNGVHSVLYKRISCLSVNNPIIKEAYNGFKEAAEVGDDFSVYDLIFGVESVIKKYEPKADSESDIYCL